MRRIHFWLADTGFGHRSVADAVASAIRQRIPSAVPIIEPPLDRRLPANRLVSELHSVTSRRATTAYDLAWRATNSRALWDHLATLLYATRRRTIRHWVEQHRPDVVVCTHPLLLADLAGRARSELGATFGIVAIVSDPVSPHASWATSAADLFFVVTEDAELSLRRRGVPPDRIVQTPLPVGAPFLRPLAKEPARSMLRLHAAQPVVLITGGGAGSGPISRNLRTIQEVAPEAQVLVAPGRSKSVAAYACAHGAHVIGPSSAAVFTAICAADVVVGKAGPSTIFEVGTVGTPLLLTAEVGVQERGNIRLAEHLGIASSARTDSAFAKELSAALRRDRSPRPALGVGASVVADALHAMIGPEVPEAV